MRLRSLPALACGMILYSSGVAKAAPKQNILDDPGFELSQKNGLPTGWAAFWSRDPGAGRAELAIDEKHGGNRSLHIVHTGADDWSYSSTRRATVSPGEVLRIGGWLKTEKTTGVELSVVTRTTKDEVADWSYGSLALSGTQPWQHVSRRIVVPRGVTSLEFRIIGNGPGEVWVDDVELFRDGNVNTARARIAPALLKLTNGPLALAVDPETAALTVTDRRSGRAWTQRSPADDVILRAAAKRDARTLRLSLWDAENDLDLTADIAAVPGRPEFKVTLRGDGPMPRVLAYPKAFATRAGESLVVPLNEGILYPADDQTVRPMELVCYSGHGICMPWFGQYDAKSGAGAMAIIGTPNDARIDIRRDAGKLLAIQPLWESQRTTFGYARAITYVFLDRGGYVAQAKRYREYAKQTGLFKTLARKRAENPNVDKLIGAANIWAFVGNKLEVARAFKQAGFQRLLWSDGGTPEELKAINALGYLTGRYDIFQDVWSTDAPSFLTHEGWPEDLVWLPNGDWMRGWAHHEHLKDGTEKVYEGGVICSSRQVPRARQRIPEDLKTHPYGARFIDTTTASPWRECWNPAHPLTRTDDRRYKMALLDYCSREAKLVVGTETGIDPSVPYVAYYEGMLSLGPYRLPDAGRDLVEYKAPTPDFLKYQVGYGYRVPLWELVYHDCVVAQYYWGDYNNKAPEVWDVKSCFNALYGTPPMYLFDSKGWEANQARFLEDGKRLEPLVRRLGYAEMTNHLFLKPDGSVQRSDWSDGTRVYSNFGATPFTAPGGRTLAPHTFLAVRGSAVIH